MQQARVNVRAGPRLPTSPGFGERDEQARQDIEEPVKGERSEASEGAV